MVKIIITPYPGYLNLEGIEYLTPERRERLYKYKYGEDRARCLAAGLLMRRYATMTKEQSYGTHGKPHVPEGPCFNVSHGGKYVIMAIGSDEIGVDIEPCEDFGEDTVRACFTPMERAFIDSAENANRAFFELWTAKESVMKLFGDGFYMPPRSFELWPPGAGRHIVRKRAVYLYSFEFDGHILCAACFRPFEAPEIVQVSAEQILQEIAGAHVEPIGT